MRSVVLLVLALFVLSACDNGSFKQDPLADESDRIRNGEHPDNRKVESRPACPIDSLLLEVTPRVSVFEEGVAGEMKISGRVLKCGEPEYKIEILNLPEEASFDQATGLFKFEPAIGTILANSYYTERHLRMRMTTLSRPVVVKEKTVVYFVSRPSERRPIITNITDLPERVHEGKDLFFSVQVKDEDSIEVNGISLPPKLRVVATDDGPASALPFMSVVNADSPIQDSVDKTLWTFIVQIATKSYDNIIKKDTKMWFGLIAVSNFGMLSESKEYDFSLLNRVGAPKVTWPKASVLAHHMQKGQKNRFVFLAFDPLSEGQVRASFIGECSQLPGTANCSCKFVGKQAGSYCSIEWEIPDTAAEKRVSFTLEVFNTNKQDSKDSYYKKITRTILLDEAPVPPVPVDPAPPAPPVPNPPKLNKDVL